MKKNLAVLMLILFTMYSNAHSQAQDSTSWCISIDANYYMQIVIDSNLYTDDSCEIPMAELLRSIGSVRVTQARKYLSDSLLMLQGRARQVDVQCGSVYSAQAIDSILANSSVVEWFERNGASGYENSTYPNDPYLNEQWAIDAINLPEAWDLETGDANIRIAIFDSGVKLDHEDLSANIDQLRMKDFVDWSPGFKANCRGFDDYVDIDNDPSPQIGPNNYYLSAAHGTEVASIACASTNTSTPTGIAGVAWNSSLVPIKVSGQEFYNAACAGNWIEEDDLRNAFDYITSNRYADVINLSYSSPDPLPNDLFDAIELAIEANIAVVVSVGNHNDASPNEINYYAAHPGVMAVGAVNSNLERWDRSEIRDYIFIMAPGVSIKEASFSSSGDDVYIGPTYANGTSFAAPHVAGVIALMKSSNPYLTVQDIKNILKETAIKVPAMNGQVWTAEYGYGIIDAFAAVSEARRYKANIEVNYPSGQVYVDYSHDDLLDGWQNVGNGPVEITWPVNFPPTITAPENGSIGSEVYHYAKWTKSHYGLIETPSTWWDSQLSVSIHDQDSRSEFLGIYYKQSDILFLPPTTCDGEIISTIPIYITSDSHYPGITTTTHYGAFADYYVPQRNTIYRVEAGEIGEYVFMQWSDGNPSQVRELAPEDDITLYPIYTRHLKSSEMYSNIISQGPTSINNQRKVASTDTPSNGVIYSQVYTSCNAVFYSYSTDYGITWSEEYALSSYGVIAESPSIYASGDLVWVVWIENNGSNIAMKRFEYNDPISSQYVYDFNQSCALRDPPVAPVVIKTDQPQNDVLVLYEAMGGNIEYALFVDDILNDVKAIGGRIASQQFPTVAVHDGFFEFAWHDLDDVYYNNALVTCQQGGTCTLMFSMPILKVDLAGRQAVGAPSIAPDRTAGDLRPVVASETIGSGGSNGITVTMWTYGGWTNPQTFVPMYEGGRFWAPSLGMIDITPAVNSWENMRFACNYTDPPDHPITEEVHFLKAFPYGGQVYYMLYSMTPTTSALHPSVTQAPSFRSGMTIFSELNSGGLIDITNNQQDFRKTANASLFQSKELIITRDTTEIEVGLGNLCYIVGNVPHPVDWKHKADTMVLGRTRSIHEEYRTENFSCYPGSKFKFAAKEQRKGYNTLPQNMVVKVKMVDAVTNVALDEIVIADPAVMGQGTLRKNIVVNMSSLAGYNVYATLELASLDTTVKVSSHDIWSIVPLDSISFPRDSELDEYYIAGHDEMFTHTLNQNYPNPFNPITTITYFVPQTMPVRIAVYNTFGALVKVIIEGEVRAGLHETTFDAVDLPSGVYYYRLDSGDAHITRQMTVIK